MIKRYDENLKDNADKIIKEQKRTIIILNIMVIWWFLWSLYFFLKIHVFTNNDKVVDEIEVVEPVEYVNDYVEPLLTRSDSILVMATAFAIIETKCNDVSSSCGKYVGYLQMSTPLVDKCNQILGKDVFCYDDRHDWNSCVTMFSLIMEYKNPNLDIDIAIDIWNKYCPHTYRSAVKNYYQFLLNTFSNLE